MARVTRTSYGYLKHLLEKVHAVNQANHDFVNELHPDPIFPFPSRGAYLQGSRRMGTFFNDIQPRNMGTNGLIFDPAIDPVTKALFWGGAGAAAYGAYELSD